MNLRNRLIWIAALTVAFAGVQLFASRRKAERELTENVKDRLLPLASECVSQTHTRSHGALRLQVGVVPEGKLDARIERIEIAASSELQDPALVACLRDRAKAVHLKQPLAGGPEQLELTLPIAPAE